MLKITETNIVYRYSDKSEFFVVLNNMICGSGDFLNKTIIELDKLFQIYDCSVGTTLQVNYNNCNKYTEVREKIAIKQVLSSINEALQKYVNDCKKCVQLYESV